MTEKEMQHLLDFHQNLDHRLTVKALKELADLRQQLAEARADLQDAAMLIRRLAYRSPGLAVTTKANDWLRRKGLQGSVLRETEEQC